MPEYIESVNEHHSGERNGIHREKIIYFLSLTNKLKFTKIQIYGQHRQFPKKKKKNGIIAAMVKASRFIKK